MPVLYFLRVGGTAPTDDRPAVSKVGTALKRLDLVVLNVLVAAMISLREVHPVGLAFVVRTHVVVTVQVCI